MKNALILLILTCALFISASPGIADMARCSECGMMVDQGSKFSSRLVQEGKQLDFCDIGDLLTYLNKRSISPSVAQVKDHNTGEPIAADKAFYVRAEKKFRTPMGWGIAAFKNRDDAASFGAPMDITAALKAVK